MFQSCAHLHLSVLLHYRQYHQEIEDFIFGLVQRYEEQKKNEEEKTQLNVEPQVLKNSTCY